MLNYTMWGWVLKQEGSSRFRLVSELYHNAGTALINKPDNFDVHLILVPFDCTDTTVTVTYGALGVGAGNG